MPKSRIAKMVSLTPEENEIVEELKKKGVSFAAVVRLGIEKIQEMYPTGKREE